MSVESKRIKGLEAMLKEKDRELEEERQNTATLEAGAREMSRLVDAILITTALAYGTDVPLGKRLSLPEIKVTETLEAYELHVTKTIMGTELMAMDRERAEAAEGMLQ